MKKNFIIGCFVVVFISLMFQSSNTNNAQIEYSEEEVEVVKDYRNKVTLTTYTIDSSQTDSTPLLTASGFKLDSINPKKHRIIAVSRDLKKKFKFGEKVLIENAGRFNGVWKVHDLMNKRYKNKIDVLINPTDKHTKLYGVIISPINP